ncbi:DUF4834 family protein [Rufibacter glacialis]|uniref:DUF4834 family protein n=1 Tax=Rufibacter glacialis TaxID=1259555 RepID=A0A5M8QDV1_9BACT|nr:DUF4834 family protein [Rufibacter glacialis]KAA6433358.1 DUF4834 family protein [Rufibacter glacialis]GGK74998.1 hypothetical protein GCM10011405_23740 [Rufibacter glacialis]
MKFILITLAVMFLLRYLMPYIIRFLLKTFVQKQMRKAQQYASFQGQAHQHQQYQQARPQGHGQGAAGGKVKVAFVPEEKRPRKDFPGGEYVDYEEVK